MQEIVCWPTCVHCAVRHMAPKQTLALQAHVMFSMCHLIMAGVQPSGSV